MTGDELTLKDTFNALLLLGFPAGIAVMLGLLLERMRKKTQRDTTDDTP